jgi:hypothetical protein
VAIVIIPNLAGMFNENPTIFGKKLATYEEHREKSLSVNQINRKWISEKQKTGV